MKERHYDTDSLFDLDEGPWAYDFKSGYWATIDGRIALPAFITLSPVYNRWTNERLLKYYFYKPKWMKIHTNVKGYLRLASCELAHRVVAQAWLPSSPKEFVNHKNGVKHDNRAENLEWVTSSENAQHKYDTDPDYKQRKKAAWAEIGKTAHLKR